MAPLSNNEEARLEKYLDDAMTAEEVRSFETELAQNPALREALDFERKLLELGVSAGEKMRSFCDTGNKDDKFSELIKEVRTDLEKINAVSDESKAQVPVENEGTIVSPIASLGHSTKVKNTLRRGLTAAAIVIGFSVVTLLFLLNRKDNEPISQGAVKINAKDSSNNTAPQSSFVKANTGETARAPRLTNAKRDSLFAAYFKPDITTAEAHEVFPEALAYYDAGQYADAAKAFNAEDTRSLSGGDTKRTQFYLHYYQSLNYLAAMNASKAVPGLQKALAEIPDHSFEAKVEWYLALARLKNNDDKGAFDLLNTVVEANAIEYSERAAKLRDEMGRE